MKRLQTMLLAFVVLGSTTLYAQKIKLTEDRLQAVDVSMSLEKIKGKKALRVVKVYTPMLTIQKGFYISSVSG